MRMIVAILVMMTLLGASVPTAYACPEHDGEAAQQSTPPKSSGQ